MLSILASSGASSAAGMGGMILWLVNFICIYVFLHDPSTEERDSEEKCNVIGTCNRRYCFDNKWLLRYSY